MLFATVSALVLVTVALGSATAGTIFNTGNITYDPRLQRYAQQARAAVQPGYIGNLYDYRRQERPERGANEMDSITSPTYRLSAEEPPGHFDYAIVHLEPLAPHYRHRRFASEVDEEEEEAAEEEEDEDEEEDEPTLESNGQAEVIKEMRHFHDIFMRFTEPQVIRFGHVEHTPQQDGQRLEWIDRGRRYHGEIIWADANGGYGLHHWDMAQGKLGNSGSGSNDDDDDDVYADVYGYGESDGDGDVADELEELSWLGA